MNKIVALSLLFSVAMMQASAPKKIGSAPAHQFYTQDLFGGGDLIPVEDSTKVEHCDISGLDRRAVLRALYSNAFVPAVGFLDPLSHRSRLSDKECDTALAKMSQNHTYLDYLNGRRMKLYFLDKKAQTLLFTGYYNDTRGYKNHRYASPQLHSAQEMIARLRVQADIITCAGKPIPREIIKQDQSASASRSGMCQAIQQKILSLLCRSKKKND